ncbi:MAG: hypothetical protein DI551_09895 [Micavibrio aeruginosavorus]|uniref:Uncharacterized protein n=1 Tax=Micavibrio aeruginosavorus TaxID=349221 RepID=A0A2W5MWH9_9BACT|nr:MAG: hypothetical protein DI551_09895 [Micavibrio aeruginosavorus]
MLMTDFEIIAQRNARVEADKAWETSWTRRFFIASLTYVFLVFYLPVLGLEKSYLHATVPVFGYLFSTMTLPFIKKWWIANSYKKKD